MWRVVRGARSHEGLANNDVLRSLFETGRRQGRHPHQFFPALLTSSAVQARAAAACLAAGGFYAVQVNAHFWNAQGRLKSKGIEYQFAIRRVVYNLFA